jgi:hypothetical protein
MIRNIPCWEADNIADQCVFVPEVCSVCFLGPRIPFTREDSFPTRRLKPLANSTDPRKKVNKGE